MQLQTTGAASEPASHDPSRAAPGEGINDHSPAGCHGFGEELSEALGHRGRVRYTLVLVVGLADGNDVPAEIRETAESLRESGISYLYCGWPGAGRDQVERFATEVLPALRT